MLVKVQPTAQWGFSSVVEQCLDKAWVGGSNPSTPIMIRVIITYRLFNKTIGANTKYAHI